MKEEEKIYTRSKGVHINKLSLIFSWGSKFIPVIWEIGKCDVITGDSSDYPTTQKKIYFFLIYVKHKKKFAE